MIDSLCFSIHPVCLIWDFYILVYSHLFSALKCISVLILMLLTRSCPPCATKMQKQNPFCGKHSIQSRRSLRARGGFDPSDFRRSFNPIPTWEGGLGPPHYYLTHQIFRPSYGLVILSSLCAARATP